MHYEYVNMIFQIIILQDNQIFYFVVESNLSREKQGATHLWTGLKIPFRELTDLMKKIKMCKGCLNC